MTKREYTLKEAANLLNKSDRTLRRYLDKLDNYDKKEYCRLVKGKILVNEQFIQFCKGNIAAPAPNKDKVSDPIKEDKKPREKEERPGINIEQLQLLDQLLETYKKENEFLRVLNLELRESIKDKDEQIKEYIKDKDEQIKEYIKDFKTLMNAVLHFQNEIKELTAAPASKEPAEATEKQPKNNYRAARVNSKTEYKLLASSLVKIIISISILLCIILLLVISLKHLL